MPNIQHKTGFLSFILKSRAFSNENMATIPDLHFDTEETENPYDEKRTAYLDIVRDNISRQGQVRLLSFENAHFSHTSYLLNRQPYSTAL